MSEIKNSNNKEILFVEDNQDFASFCQANLACHGIDVVLASSIKEACRIFDQRRMPLITLDWRLAGEGREESGLEFLRFCKERMPEVVVIVLTGATHEMQVQDDALRAKADSFLKKPISPEALAIFLKQWLQRIDRVSQSALPERIEDAVSWKEFRKVYIRHVVKLCEGNVSLAADKLDMHRHTVSVAIKDKKPKKKKGIT